MLGLIKGRSSKVAASSGVEKRFTFDDLYNQVKYLGNVYPLGLQMSMPGNGEEQIDQTFGGFAEIYRKSGPVFACLVARTTLFSEARFQFQRFSGGRPSTLYGSRQLQILENPWENGDTGEMLARAEQDISLAGNWFVHQLTVDRLRRLQPDWMTIVLGSQMEVQNLEHAIDAQVIGYAYEPPGEKRQFLLPESVVHWSPVPDPIFNYRGMSWLPAALTDVQADRSAAMHRQAFFDNSATSNFVVLPDKDIGIEEFRDFREDFTENYEGAWNAFKTIFLGGGSDVKVLGLDFEKMDFKNVQGAGETRIAAAARVPPIVAGFSEGLAAATYSNYGQARRAFGDGWARPQWRSVANALSKFVKVPGGSRLWYDDRDIPFLREDLSDEAEIRSKDAGTISTLITAGYEPDAAVEFVASSNLNTLKGGHTGKLPVQLQDESEEGGEDPGEDSDDEQNGDTDSPPESEEEDED